MKTFHVLTILPFSLCFLCSATSAGLLTVDGWTVGDERLTRDTQTGLDWLDLTVTDNKSINDIFVSHFGNLDGLGFRLATLNEVATLFTHAGAIGDPFVVTTNAANLPIAQYMMSLLGDTSAPYGFSTVDIHFMEGRVLSPAGGLRLGAAETYGPLDPGGRSGTATIQVQGVDQAPHAFAVSHRQNAIGVFLVR